jgi:hypothetical protein
MSKRAIALSLLFALLVVTLSGARASDAAPTVLPDVLPITVELQHVQTDTGLFAYDARRELIYAGSTGVQPITLAGQTGPSFATEWQPTEMVVSPDGQILYLLDWRTPSIVLIDLDTRATLDEWPLATSRGAPYMPLTIAALPGEPALLIAYHGLGGGYSYGIGVVDAEGLRPATVEVLNPPHFQLADAPDTVFGLVDSRFMVLRVDETGVSLTASYPGLVGWGTFTYADGFLFGRDGSLASTAPFQRLGRFNTDGSVVPDPARGYAYYLQDVMNEAVYLQAFDIATMRKVAETTLDLPQSFLSHADGLIRTGDDSYAVLGNDGLYLLRFKIHDHAVAIPLVANEFCADFFDDFSGPTPFPWPERDNAAELVAVDGSELYVEARTAAPVLIAAPVCYRPNFELTVDVREVGDEPGYYGLLYQVGGSSEIIWVGGMVNPREQWWSHRLEGGHGEFNEVIHPDGEKNRLRLTFRQTILDGTLDFYVNDIRMYWRSTQRLPARDAVVGLIVLPHWSGSAAARFDNFRFSALKPERVD